jgi:hypothetical protein
MAFDFKSISDTEFHVNDHAIVKDSNGNWISNPPIEGYQLRKAVNNYITSLEKN